MQAIYDLLSDTQLLSGVSTAGDAGTLRRSSSPAAFLDGFRSHLLMSVETGRWMPFKYGETFPANMQNNECSFLRGLQRQVFAKDGSILACPDPVAFRLLYQVASFLEKFGSDSISDEMKTTAISSFIEDEEDIAALNLEGQVELLGLARELIERHILSKADFRLERQRHGPGAVSEGHDGPGEKYRFTGIPELGIYWPELHPDQIVKGNFVSTDQYGESGKTSRLCFVPKNRRKCRIICAEPSLLQYLQQGLRRPLYQALEGSHLDINLRVQTTNQVVARESSEHGYYSTLDLKAASDRMSLKLVGALFPTPLFAKMVACRSTFTWIPGIGRVRLQKFGSMGNALTFPVQTIVFWSLICAQRILCGDREAEAVLDTWVYGDDIICPSRHARAVMMALEACGLRVNRDKSYIKGPFRESCGMHAFQGCDVTPAYLRTRVSNPESLFSICACARTLDRLGYRLTAESLYKQIERHTKEKMPFTHRDDCLSRYLDPDLDWKDVVAFNTAKNINVHHDRYYRPCVKAFRLSPRRGRPMSFDNTWDMWDYIGPNGGTEYDRGVIAGGVRLTRASMPLLV